MSLVVIATHPVQYHAPVYRALQAQFGLPVTVIYGSDFSVAGYYDREFGTNFAWDTDLLSGYESIFLSRMAAGGARSYEEVAAKGLDGVLRSKEPSAILLLGYHPRFNLQAFWVARRMGCPLLLRAETTDRAIQRSWLKQSGRDFALRNFYRRFAQLLYIGEDSHAHYTRLGCPETRLVFSPYCVDTAAFDLTEAGRERWRKQIRTELGIEDHQTVLLFSGKLVPRKAPEMLLQSIGMLTEELRERIAIVYVGDGVMRSELEAMAKGNPDLNVRFVGFQNQSYLSRYYHAADLLVFPSRANETWGLVVNEALHHGLPCIVSDRVGCAPDLVKAGVTGEIFVSGSVTELARAIERGLALLEQPDRQAKCREIISSYTVERAAQGIFQAYSSAVQSSI